MQNINTINNLDDMHTKLHYIENNIETIKIDDIHNFLYISHKFIIHNSNIDEKEQIYLNKRLKLLDDYIDNLNDINTSNSTYRLLVINTLLLFISLFIAYYSNQKLPIIGDDYFKKKNGEYIFLITLFIIGIITLFAFKINLL